jgi:hypothetical protein
MGINIEDYVDVEQKLSELGCRPALGLAMLPQNFQSAGKIADFRQMSEAATVKKMFRAAGLELTELVDRPQRPPYIHNNYADWVAPTLFLSSALCSQNPNAISVALSIIANYLTDLFKGVKTPTVKLEFVVEKTKSRKCMMVKYEGDVTGIASLEGVLRKVVDD